MTPQEKAKELFDKFSNVPLLDSYEAKQCALIAIDEMILQNGELYLNSLGDKTINFYKEKNNYLFKVKQEIEKL
jgi:hypothetical protein